MTLWLGKYLLVRRDGTSPAWNNLGFVLGPRDPHAAAALLAYGESVLEAATTAAAKVRKEDEDGQKVASDRLAAAKELCEGLINLANAHEAYQKAHGVTDPLSSAGNPWRTEAYDVMVALEGRSSVVCVLPEDDNKKTAPPKA